ncbi:MAG: hypothetical protein KIS87_11560 [Phycisphaeraceae bacterium]|nr:hypothetical protein [Phycisphaeraceae bacterium]
MKPCDCDYPEWSANPEQIRGECICDDETEVFGMVEPLVTKRPGVALQVISGLDQM